MLLNEYKRNFFRLLNEGAAEMYRDSYYPEVDDYILEKIIEIDPESNGDDLSDFGKLLLKLNPQMSDFEQLRKDIEIFAKAVRNGAEVPDVKTVEELHYAAVDLANSNAHMSGDEVNAQEESLGCPTVYSDGEYRVIDICNQEAAGYYGKGTMWIWGANNGKMFNQYAEKGKIFVILKGAEKYAVIRMGSRLRITDAQDENVSKDMFPQELLTALTGVNENKMVHLSEKELIDMLVEAVEKKIRKKQLKEDKKKSRTSLSSFNDDIQYNGDEWMIVTPTSWDSSCAWGRGTSWDISAPLPEYKRFWDVYSKDGELFFIIHKSTNEKYAFFFGNKYPDVFIDSMNNEIGTSYDVLSDIECDDDCVYEFFDERGLLDKIVDDGTLESWR